MTAAVQWQKEGVDVTLKTFKGALAGVALAAASIAMSSNSASAACQALNFVDSGCFTSAAYVSNQVGGTDDPAHYVGIKDNGGSAGLTLGSDNKIFAVTFFAAMIAPNNPFTLTIFGFQQVGTNANFVTINSKTPTFYSFYSSGGVAGLTFGFLAAPDAPTGVEIGHINAVQAPAPLPGAGFLSFLGLAFAGMWRRGRSMAARIMGRREAATA